MKNIKFKNIVKNIFNGKNKKKSIIAIVALIQCIILVGLMTYSWIESASSLIIEGEKLPISDNINYRFDICNDSDSPASQAIIDLSTYFRPTALYQMANASSPDGVNFYFKNTDNSYRQGDTTDYNTSYYNFDFYVHNDTNKNINYYFKEAEIFSISSDQLNPEKDSKIINAAKEAFRIAVTTGANAANTRIYSYSNTEYKPVNNVSGELTTNNIQSFGLSGNSKYVYHEGNNSDDDYVFTSTGGGDDTRVNLKIWFEEKHPSYANLSDVEKKKLEGAIVNINLSLTNAESSYRSFFFDDYTFSTASGYEGKHVTSEGSNMSLYFHYKIDVKSGDETVTEEASIPMTISESTDIACTRWITASSEGVPTPRIKDSVFRALKDNPDCGYFYYGTSDSPTTAKYKWSITAPASNEEGSYVFKALSVMTFGGKSTGYGVWDTKETPIKLWYLRDQTTCSTADPYNPNSFKFISDMGQNRLYLSDSTNATSNTTRMYYDKANDIFKGYYLDIDNLVFSYTKAADYKDSNIAVQWEATNSALDTDTNDTYTALGYTGTGAAGFQSKAAGVGTWSNTEEIKFSTELVDASMNKDKDYRYKIGVDFDSGSTESYKYYYMALADNATCWKAYVPVDSGTTKNNIIKFQRFADPSSDTVVGTWSNGIRDKSSVFYATDIENVVSKGQWHIAVVVDGSSDNIINDVLTNVENSSLEYSIDGGTTYSKMNKLDNHRWYTNSFSSSVSNILYKWTAYSGEGPNSAVFTYGHNLSNGIYFNITE